MKGEEEERNSVGKAAALRLQSMAERYGCLVESFPWRVFDIQPLIRSTADLLTGAIRECLRIEKQEN